MTSFPPIGKRNVLDLLKYCNKSLFGAGLEGI